MAGEKRYTVMVEVEADPKDAAKLRRLLPDLLDKAGFVVTSSTTTAESWLMAAKERLHSEPRTRGMWDPGSVSSGTSRKPRGPGPAR
jgi:predicted TIM-barrel fold metal-dependent hydrolase